MIKKGFILLFCFNAILLGSCSEKKNNLDPYGFSNSDFEKGDLSNWELFGSAFTYSHVEFLIQNSSGVTYNQEGDFFYYGGKNSDNLIGYMISEPFQLNGNGRIGYLIGAGRDSDTTYVAVIDKDGNVVTKSGNKASSITDGMHRQVFDLPDYIGQTLRIKIVDMDTSSLEYSYINVDDFIINYQGEANMSIPLSKANNYVENNINQINRQYRHTYHAMSQLNWSNDPNGLIWFNNQFHLFYQHNPYGTVWGPMHWGHYTTTDFVKWERQPIALAPDQVYDNQFGAFSGTAIEKDGLLYLMYTSVANNQQTQSIAYSEDGIHFIKIKDNPVIPSSLNPSGVNPNEIRDPKVFYHEGLYYVIVGTKIDGRGQMVLYRSTDLTHFEYVGPLLNNNQPTEEQYFPLNGVFECPDFMIIDGKQIILASPQNINQIGTQFENIHGNIYMIGSLNFQTGQWNYDIMHEIDSGFDFYAPQTATLPDGRTIMIAWMQMWDRTLPTQSHGWIGSYTLPRELSIIDGKLYQTPVREIMNYRQNEVVYQNQQLLSGTMYTFDNVLGKTIELEVEFDVSQADQVGIELFKGSNHATKVYFDRVTSTVVLDRSNSGIPITGRETNNQTRSASVQVIDGKVKLRIFLDVSSIEVFINDGAQTLTALVYPDQEDNQISFYTIGGQAFINNLKKYDIIVD